MRRWRLFFNGITSRFPSSAPPISLIVYSDHHLFSLVSNTLTCHVSFSVAALLYPCIQYYCTQGPCSSFAVGRINCMICRFILSLIIIIYKAQWGGDDFGSEPGGLESQQGYLCWTPWKQHGQGMFPSMFATPLSAKISNL